MSIFNRRVTAVVIAAACVIPVAAQLPPATTTRVSVATSGTQGNGSSYSGPSAISADGRFVAFDSEASNLVGGDTNGWGDVFVHDRATGATTRVSVATGGAQGNGDSGAAWDDVAAISADGRFVAFFSEASNLVAGDTNGVHDVFVHDRDTGVTTRVSVGTGGTEGNGRAHAIPAISADGGHVAFTSEATNLVAGDTNDATDIFVHDRDTGSTTRVSVGTDGTEGNGYSWIPSLSADGTSVAFYSSATNLVAEE
jgi:Tol biopolymer transport system component